MNDSMNDSIRREVIFVLKLSKFCNLRCKYCYEMEELGSRGLMSLEQLRRMYSTIHDYYTEADRRDGMRTTIQFNWHGGEPMLVEPGYYRRTFSAQREIFGDRLDVVNSVQTNLTVLDDERIQLLRDGFDGVGVSIDLFGGLRVNLSQRDQQGRVLRNMDRLREAGVTFGCITVLTRSSIKHLKEIYRFYESAGISFRILPLHGDYRSQQHDELAVSPADVLDAYCTLADLWLQGDGSIRVIPVLDYIETVIKQFTPGRRREYFDPRAWMPLLAVNTNGDCQHLSDPYGSPEWTLGNIFTMSLAEILSGAARERSIRATEERMAFNCARCKYFGSCSGYPNEFHNCQEVSPSGVRICAVEPQLYDHIERRLRQAGLLSDDRFVGERPRGPRLSRSSPSELV
ncbi:radical SAM protein [Sorangium sp. So ce341]|uniref:radical SAM protein n=1 Tax=Sorangium sp. So ce341 TaxID=3133302 RepID=UPI003F5E46F3